VYLLRGDTQGGGLIEVVLARTPSLGQANTRRDWRQHEAPQGLHRGRQGTEAEHTSKKTTRGRLAMLVYIFSHVPAKSTDIGAYEDVLRNFHAELARSRPPGFVASTTYRIADAYSDWYLVDSSAALDALNDAAVTGSRRGRHDAAARMAASGTGKLMRLAQGQPDLEALHEVGFPKPAGMAYADLYAQLEEYTAEPGAALWQRMMVLGPPPELCLVTRGPVELPAQFSPEPHGRRQI